MPQRHSLAPADAIPISDYDYELPQELIAQTPIEPRDSSRLMVVERARNRIEHRVFRDVGDYLTESDLLVVNDSRVLPARLHGWRPSGGKAELLLLRRIEDRRWQALVRPGRRLKPGSEIVLADTLGRRTDATAVIVERISDGQAIVQLSGIVDRHLNRFGEMPLPPYIHEHLTDPNRYQTVYAEVPGSAAAPTAGLHFTPDLIDRLGRQGVRVARVTLHVGAGTFMPVKVEDASRHEMHAEWFHVPLETIRAIRETHERNGRVIAVGTTSCRTLESIDLREDQPGGASDWSRLFITPGYRFRNVDALITNFHLPRSTLLLLVSAFAGRDRILNAYREAISQRYRFYSFGDAMLIL